MLGKFEADLKTEGKVTSHEVIHITQGAGGSFLSWQTSQNLGIISIASPLATERKPKVQNLVE